MSSIYERVLGVDFHRLHPQIQRRIMFPETGRNIPFTIENYAFVDLRSGAQRFYEGLLGFRFPMLFSGIADVHEWYDDDAQCFRIVVKVHNRVWGPLFGYRGSFNVEWRKVVSGTVPTHILPRRQECRD